MYLFKNVSEEITNGPRSRMCVIKMSHRRPQFKQIITEAEQDLRQLLAIPDDFAVLFTQGGAQAQNALVPLNLLGLSADKTADYVVSGRWSQKSFEEAQRIGAVRLAASSNQIREMDATEYAPYTWFPEPAQWDINEKAAYVHACSNETVGGLEFADWP